MADIVTDLAALLSQARRPGDFSTAGTTELLTPALSVDGVGPIALPLLPVQAAQLVAVAEQAPYGRGPDTIVDTSVRNTWQIAPEHVRIGGRHWPRTLEAILALVAEGLGVSDPIEAEFYKLLVYDRGSFFVSHRDTEKSPGMFATLVVVLPSACTGGALVVRHKDREVRFDLQSDDPSEAAFAAFYADCLHEVLPVTEGCRLTLVYNLIRRGKGRAPEPPNYSKEQTQVADRLRAWRAEMDADADVPIKLVYPLEHAYTAPDLAFSALKGADAAAAGVLAAAAKQAGCALHLALVELQESGSADYAEGYYDRRGRSRWHDDEDENEEEDDENQGGFEVGEIGDCYTSLTDWRAHDGHPVSWGAIPVDDEELSPPDPFHALKPDELHFQEASGNAGVSFERRYRRAALVVWPNDRAMAVLTQAGLGVTVPHLGDLTECWIGGGAESGSTVWQEAHNLAGCMIDDWPQHAGGGSGTEATAATGMLQALTRLRDTTSISAFLKRVTAAGVALKLGDNAAIVAALSLFPADAAVDLLERIVTGNAAKRFAACADLLRRAPADLPGMQPADLAGSGTTLLAALPGAPPGYDWSGGTDALDAGFVADLAVALGRIDAGLADRAVTWVITHPRAYDPDATLVPAARDRLGNADVAQQPAVARLRAACLAHVGQRIALPLEPPADWTRPSAVGCRCQHCTGLSRFLADPKQRIWIFRAVAADRGHVEGTIREAACDVDTKTESRGRPYSLICTKNQASYDRRVAQRRQDLADAERLQAIGA
jgi:hypothetical protein